MKIIRTESRNYGSFRGEHSLQVAGRGLTLVIGENDDEPRMDSNGAAKSTAFEMIDWCLFGVIPKGDHVDSVINDHEDDVSVTTYLDDDGTPLSVTRSKGRGKSLALSFTVGDRVVTSLDTKETQKLLDKSLGLDRDVFHAVVFYAQTDLFHFADTTSDAQRMEVATKIFGLEDIDGWLERAKDRLKAVDTEFVEAETATLTLQAREYALVTQVPQLQDSVADYDRERAESLRTAILQLNEMNGGIAHCRQTAALRHLVERNLTEWSLSASLSPTIDLTHFDGSLNSLRTQRAEVVAELGALERAGLAAKKKLDDYNLKQVGDCSECGQPVTAEHLAVEVAKLSANVDKLRGEWAAMQPTVAALNAQLDKVDADRRFHLEAHEVASRQRVDVKAELDKQLATVVEAENYLRKAEPHAAGLQDKMAAIQSRPNPWSAKLAENEDAIRNTRQQIQSTTLRLKVLDDQRRVYGFWVKGFGIQGLKSYILDAKLQEMTEAANEWVTLLTGGTIWVRFESQKLGRSTKKLSNKITIRVFRYNPDGTTTERNYQSWSGGEKRRVSWAIDFGLSRLIARRATKNWNQLILDEVFKYVDAAGGEAVMDMLRCLRMERSDIFVIEHDAAFKSQFENRLLVRKTGGVSRVYEDSDDNEEEPKTTAKKSTSNGVASKAESPRKKKRGSVSVGKVPRKRARG